MPYNTRRKSLSLPALGIQLPQASRVHRNSLSRPSNGSETQQAPPAKKLKRSHTYYSPSPASPTVCTPPSSAVSITKSVTFAERPKSSGRYAHEHTPPPSPGDSYCVKIDVEGINDDVVVGVIEQLEKTGNRPHLIKELATVLSTTNSSISTYGARSDGTTAVLQNKVADKLNRSANPTALLSSRLASYMKRQWSAIAPCPIAKELIPVHPRKVFYYLTTTPRQELPASPIGGTAQLMLPPPHVVGTKRVISPSLSNESREEDGEDNDDKSSMADHRKRAALSPSPEIDLSIDLEDAAPAQIAPDFPTPGSSLSSGRGSVSRETLDPERDIGMHRRAESPPLEGDEREFTDTARDMRMRDLEHQISGQGNDVTQRLAAAKLDAAAAPTTIDATVTEEEHLQRNSEAVAALFGPHHQHQQSAQTDAATAFSSPLIGPTDSQATHIKTEDGAVVRPLTIDTVMDDISILGEHGVTFGMGLGWDIERPENTGIDELDGYFEDF